MSYYSSTHPEQHGQNVGAQLNWLRAGVLGANDGIVSVAGLLFGVVAVNSSNQLLLLTGVAGIISGAISMAVGEYVSVSSAKDSEQALLEKERYELKHFPKEELEELIELYEERGLIRKTAETVAKELTKKDVFAAHVDIELGGIDPDNLTNPMHAAVASAVAFLCGAVIPVIAILIPPQEYKIPVAFVAVVIALALTGSISAKIGGASVVKAVFRVVLGGIMAMLITYLVGTLFNVSGI